MALDESIQGLRLRVMQRVQAGARVTRPSVGMWASSGRCARDGRSASSAKGPMDCIRAGSTAGRAVPAKSLPRRRG